MNMQHSLIWVLYNFEKGHNDAEATKNIMGIIKMQLVRA